LSKTAIIVFYKKDNIYSLNAIIGALETSKDLLEIDIFFVRGKKKLFKKIEQSLANHNKTILALSFFTSQVWQIRKLITQIRKRYGNTVFICAGGPHPSGRPKDTLNMGVDIVVKGEGERSFTRLVERLHKGMDYSDIPGLSYIDSNGEFVINKIPKYQDFVNLDNYPPFPLVNTRFGAIEITRGCPYQCYFCQTSFMLGTKPRHRSIKSICKHVKVLAEPGYTDLRFITPNALSYGSKTGISVNYQKLKNLLVSIREILGKEGRIFFGTFPSEIRPEHINQDTLNLIKEYTDNDNIIIGAQSGSQRMLDKCNRGHTVEDIINAVELTLIENLEVNLDFIFGLPDETEKDIIKSIDLIKELTNKGAKIHAHYFVPLPQTPFQFKTPNPLSEKLRKEIKNLNYRGKLYGNWKKHEKLSSKVSDYLLENKK
jgi:B12-binding domain/radical SAM domain protein